MARYRGAKLRITRRLGDLPGLTSKIAKRTSRPGQHGLPGFPRWKACRVRGTDDSSVAGRAFAA